MGGDQPAAVPRQVVAAPWATGSLQEGMAPTDLERGWLAAQGPLGVS